MVRGEARRDEVEPVRVRRPAVDAQHRPPSGGAVIQVVELDAVRFDEMARAGCSLKIGHCLERDWFWGRRILRQVRRRKAGAGRVAAGYTVIATSCFPLPHPQLCGLVTGHRLPPARFQPYMFRKLPFIILLLHAYVGWRLLPDMLPGSRRVRCDGVVADRLPDRDAALADRAAGQAAAAQGPAHRGRACSRWARSLRSSCSPCSATSRCSSAPCSAPSPWRLPCATRARSPCRYWPRSPRIVGFRQCPPAREDPARRRSDRRAAGGAARLQHRPDQRPSCRRDDQARLPGAGRGRGERSRRGHDRRHRRPRRWQRAGPLPRTRSRWRGSRPGTALSSSPATTSTTRASDAWVREVRRLGLVGAHERARRAPA